MTTRHFIVLTIISLALSMMIDVRSASAQACCFNYWNGTDPCCDHHILACSTCENGFMCCPIKLVNHYVPDRYYPAANGWKVFTSIPTGLGAMCRFEYQTAHCDPPEWCQLTGVIVTKYCVTDEPPEQNCPPCD